MTARLRTLASIAALGVALGSGCGGGGDAASEPAGPGERAERSEDRPGSPASGTETGDGRTSGEADGGDSTKARKQGRDRQREETREGERGRDADVGGQQQRERRRGERDRPEAPRSRGPTRAEAIAVGDRICTRFRREVAHLDPGEGDDFERLARRTAALRRLTADAVEDFRAVDVPRSVRSDFRGYVDAIAAQLPVLDDLRRAAERRDRRAVSDATARIEALGEAAKRFARRVGFRVCGSA